MEADYPYDIFLSHNSEDKLAVLELAKRLKSDGLTVWLDDWVIQPGDNIFLKIEEGLDQSEKVVLVLSPRAIESKWVGMEKSVALFRDPTNDKRRFIPLLLEPCKLSGVMSGILYIDYHKDKEKGYQKLLRQFQGRILPVKPFQQDIDISRLPSGSTQLVGRKTYLQQLDDSLNSDQITMVSFIAGGGVGKSALVEYWTESHQNQGFVGIEKIFGWSFYSQGNHETQNSSASFFSEALPFFGYEGEPITQEEEKATQLAKLLKNQTSLLILDGLEPLQNKEDIQDGYFKDRGLYRLMKNLSKNGLHQNGQNSLVLMTSRQSIVDLKSYGLYHEIKLDFLTTIEGSELLRSLGVTTGLDWEYKNTVQEMKGHALGLVLLGKVLTRYHKGDIARRDKIKDLFKSNRLGDHARKIMDYYDTDTLWGKSVCHTLFLRLIGLFDRPMEETVYNILKEKADIAQPLKILDEDDFNSLKQDLKSAGLLLMDEQEKRYDAHPLVRDYFGKKLKEKNPQQFQQCHQVLFDYFQTVPEKDQPDSLEELEPLYRAVHHGCRAGMYKKVLYDVYHKRICRGDEGYSMLKLGAYSSDLAALSGFFPKGWHQPPVSEGLSEDGRAWLLGETSFCLMSLGRMLEAVGPRRQGMLLRVQLEKWEAASINATSLCDLLIVTGQLAEAHKTATQGKQWAEKSGDLFRKMVLQTYVATTLHRLGKNKESLMAFEEAERLQVERKTGYPRLLGPQGKNYCDLLLEQAQKTEDFEDVFKRAEDSLKALADLNHLLSIALDHLTQGRALSKLGQTKRAEDLLNKAVAGIQKAGKMEFTPEFLLHRASFFRDQANLFHQQENSKRQQTYHDNARQDLEEGLEISVRCSMILYEADLKLLEVDLLLDEADWLDNTELTGKKLKIKEAEQSLLRAESLIQKMNYGKIRTQAKTVRKRLENM